MSEEQEQPRDLPTRDERSRSVWGEMWAYLKVRKKWWLAPMLVILLSLGALAVFTETSALAPFIYTLF